jgi:hypothetical protein
VPLIESGSDDPNCENGEEETRYLKPKNSRGPSCSFANRFCGSNSAAHRTMAAAEFPENAANSLRAMDGATIRHKVILQLLAAIQCSLPEKAYQRSGIQ